MQFREYLKKIFNRGWTNYFILIWILITSKIIYYEWTHEGKLFVF